MFKCFGGVSSCKSIKLLFFDIVLCEKQVYTPGSEVSGHCIIHLNGEMNLNQLEIKIKGTACAIWSEGRVNSDNQSTINSGEYHIPFNIQLPDSNIPSSFEGEYGWIRYRVKAKIQQSSVSSHNYKIHLPITISSPANVSAMQLKGRSVCDVQKTVGLCCTEGYVSLKCETNCGQIVGRAAMIHCYAKNRSNSQIILRARLKQIICYTAGSRGRNETKTITNNVPYNIQPHSLINECLSLAIPSELPVSLILCPHIKIYYNIIVSVYIPFAFRNLRACLPIIITNQEFNHHNH